MMAPGFYWVRDKATNRWRVVEIYEHAGESFACGVPGMSRRTAELDPAFEIGPKASPPEETGT